MGRTRQIPGTVIIVGTNKLQRALGFSGCQDGSFTEFRSVSQLPVSVLSVKRTTCYRNIYTQHENHIGV